MIPARENATVPSLSDLLDVMCCPVGRVPLRLMTTAEVRELNALVAAGRTGYVCGGRPDQAIERALAAADGSAVYPVEGEVPILLPGRRITRGPAAPRAQDGDGEAAVMAEFWEKISLHWDDRTPPARPAPEDTAILESFVGEALGETHGAAPRALVLGVTPEVATMRWPGGTRVLALDSSRAMIRNVWPARAVAHGAAICGEWSAMPLRPGTCDAVVGDASLGIQAYPGAFFAVLAEVRRVLRDGGVLAMRVFTRPEKPEPVAAVFDDLRAGRIRNLDFFRWRLAAALHGDRASGAVQGAMWDAWEANVPDPEALIRSLGWPPSSLPVMANARGSRVAMIFPTLSELRADLAADFEEIACEAPAYQDGERYPTFAFRLRPRAGGVTAVVPGAAASEGLA